MNKLEKAGIGVAIFTSIIAVGISAFSLYFANEANNIAKKQIESNLTVDIIDGKLPTAKFTDLIQKDIIFFESENPVYGASFFKDYYLLVSNQGMKSTLIEDENVMEFLENGWVLPDGTVDYRSKNFWATTDYKFLTDKNEKVLYPIRLDPNSSKLFILKVKYSVPKFAWDMAKLEFDTLYQYDIAEEIFFKIGYPFWGQKSPDIQQNNNVQTSSPNKYYQRFCLTISDNEGHRLKVPVEHHIHMKIDVMKTAGDSWYCK